MNPTDLTLSTRHNWLGLDIKVDCLGLVISPHSVRVLSNIRDLKDRTNLWRGRDTITEKNWELERRRSLHL